MKKTLICILLFLPVLSFAQFEVGLGTSSNLLLLGGTARVAYHRPVASYGITMESATNLPEVTGFVGIITVFANHRPVVKPNKNHFWYIGWSASYGWMEEAQSTHPAIHAKLLGMYAGLSWRCGKHIYMNSEWGVRGGLWQGYEWKRYRGYEPTEELFAYFPATISVNYRF